MIKLKNRIGFDSGNDNLESNINWGHENGFRFMDFNADYGENSFKMWNEDRIKNLRKLCNQKEMSIGLHTLSGVNIAEISPFVSESVDEYLDMNLSLANDLGCKWMIVHGGYHFNAIQNMRIENSIRRIKKIVSKAKRLGIDILFENLNPEPNKSEFSYLGDTVDNLKIFMDEITESNFKWAFTINHANLFQNKIKDFWEYFGVDRIGEVRLADNDGDEEIHMNLGEGNIDFNKIISEIEQKGYQGHYSLAVENKISGKNHILNL